MGLGLGFRNGGLLGDFQCLDIYIIFKFFLYKVIKITN